jgi:hypothetical protein
MENVAHFTQQSVSAFVLGISSTFVAQIETKMENDDVKRSEVAHRLDKTTGRVSQILNNPGNLSLRVMVEVAGTLGMKVSVLAYDDRDPKNENGPIDPEVFVKCWERAGRPTNLFDFEDVLALHAWEGYSNYGVGTDFSIGAEVQYLGHGVNLPGYVAGFTLNYSAANTVEPVKFLNNFKTSASQVPAPNDLWHTLLQSEMGGLHQILQQQEPETAVPNQENAL